MRDIALYIHIPFCEKKCYYCDFTSFANKKHLIDKYIDYLIREIDLYKEDLKDYRIKTIFIGGGTPSAIDEKHIKRIMDHIGGNFSLAEDLEATIEINPATLTDEKARLYRKSLINRASLGLQTLNNNQLKKIGRIHRDEDFFKSYNILRENGFENINVDLIFGLPDQDLDDLNHDLDSIIDLGPEHISYYGLILEPGTPMAKWYEEGRLDIASEDEERDMYHRIINRLTESGYGHYEISNYAKKSYECRHNMIYWKIKPYIGLGLASHSNFKSRRFWNYSNFQDYFQALDSGEVPTEGQELIDKTMEMAEYCIFGIRLMKGINKAVFENRFSLRIEDLYGNIIKKHIEGGLLLDQEGYISLTSKGIDLANQVEVDFLP